MHGSITDRSVDPHINGLGIQRRIQDEYRMCVYDRRNVGHSDTVDAEQTPDDALTDMHNLLTAAGVDPPYVLLGASFGGNLAYLYANTYPDEVVGMVLLDSQFPDELSLEHYFPPEDHYKAFDREDADESLERISHYAVFRRGQKFIGREPAIPVVYFASIPEGYGTEEGADPAYKKEVVQVQQAYVDRFSPGTYIRVDAPHFMEPAIPVDIADALRMVIDQGGD
jgi:pimeloyl-ACP methyl ester carboxylesterase